MQTLIICALLVITLAVIQATPGDRCRRNRQCDDGECCLKPRRNGGNGRRRRVGTCQLYSVEGEACGDGCGCAPALTCEPMMSKECDVSGNPVPPAGGGVCKDCVNNECWSGR